MATTRITGQQLGDGQITDADIATANKDGSAATPSMRTLGTSSTQASAGNHTHSDNYTGVIVILEQRHAAGVSGGTLTAGSWVQRPLNTEVSDAYGLCTPSFPTFTLVAGYYEAHCEADAFYCDNHQIRLYDSTNSQFFYGTMAYNQIATNGCQTTSRLVTTLTLTSTSTLALEHRCQTTSATYGMGVNLTSWGTSVFARCFFRKLSG